jgi:hypothetical protein
VKQTRRKLPEGVTLRRLTEDEAESFPSAEGPVYAVSRAGLLVGHVFRSPVTLERRTAGKRYVNARWTSLRWRYQVAGEWRSSPIWRDTRIGAILELLP